MGIAAILRRRRTNGGNALRLRLLLLLLLLAVATACTEHSTGDAAAGGAGNTGGAQPATGGMTGVVAGAGTGAAATGGTAGAAIGTAGTAGVGGSAAAGGSNSGTAGVAGTTEDAGPAGNGAAGAEAPGCSAATFCDSFDATPGATLDPARWEVVMPSCSGTGQVALDDAVAHSGARSLRVDGAAGYCNHVFARPVALAAPLPDPLYARFYLRLGTALGAAHVTFAAMHDAVEDRDLRMGGQSEILMWNRESDDATLPELSPTGIAGSVRPATQTWLCVELMIDAAGQTMRTWVDGAAVAGLTVEGDATPDIDAQWRRKSDWQPQLQDVRLGWESYGDATNTLWFDDVAIGAARLGCTQ